MIKAFVRVKNDNLPTGQITLDKDLVLSYYQDKLSSLAVLTEDNVFVEEYYGVRLRVLMESVSDSGKGYLFAKRNLMK